ncbi:MAG: phosphoadenylyl-sulfate reductase, partial [Victivallales bacterium]
TYDTIAETMDKYSIRYDILFPEQEEVEKMERENGPNLFHESIEKRKLCCEIRKIRPLRKYLSSLDAWICGLRREQSVTRTAVEQIQWDDNFGLAKLNPLASWTEADVWKYIRKNKVPYNKLHDFGYPSIGCSPCTRAVKAGEHPRAGRWWWEEPEKKECGLHVVDGKLARNSK